MKQAAAYLIIYIFFQWIVIVICQISVNKMGIVFTALRKGPKYRPLFSSSQSATVFLVDIFQPSEMFTEGGMACPYVFVVVGSIGIGQSD